MVVTIESVAIRGVHGYKVDVETDISNGLPAFWLVWLWDAAVQEARERVRAAVRNSGYKFPAKRVTVNLAPADLRKTGPGFDLPIALSIVLEAAEIPLSALKDTLFLWELALDGSLRSTEGVLIASIFAKEAGYRRIFVPKSNAQEAASVGGIEVIGSESLIHVVEMLRGNHPIHPQKPLVQESHERIIKTDFAEIVGQSGAKRALEIGAAWGHHILLSGSPGSGKSLLARAFEGILPSMDNEESLETSSVYSVAWLLSEDFPLVRERPFRTVYHTATSASLVWWGAKGRPGEMALAHRGVLFLDEFLEFDQRTLETLRQPLEEWEVRLSRASGSYRYPARFTLVAATNPCPCGFRWDSEKECTCPPHQIRRYESRLSGPIEDRIDLVIPVARLKTVDFAESSGSIQRESSIQVRSRVEHARLIQYARFWGRRTNAEMTAKEIREFIVLDTQTEQLLERAVDQLDLSGRAYFRTLKLARTIADLANSEKVLLSHVSEALGYRRRKSS